MASKLLELNVCETIYSPQSTLCVNDRGDLYRNENNNYSSERLNSRDNDPHKSGIAFELAHQDTNATMC